MASTADNALTAGPEVQVSLPEALPVEEGKADRSIRSFYRLQEGRLLPCEPNEAQIIAYVSPTIDDEAELQELYKIDYHTLQSSLDPDELSRLEIEPDHAAIIFKRPKSFCADDNFLLKLTSTGIFVYPKHLVIVMADDSPIFEGRVPFPVKSIHDVILRLLRQQCISKGTSRPSTCWPIPSSAASTRLWKTNISSTCSRSKRALNWAL